MKRTLICTALSLSMLALPVISEAGGPRGDGDWRGGGRGGHSHGYDRGHGGDYYRGRGNNHNGVLPWLLGAAAVGAVVSIASQPYYGGSTVYYNAPPPPPTTVYYGTPSYGYVTPPQTCTYYPDGSSYCR